MKIELLAKKMRERAQIIELEERSGVSVSRAKTLPKPEYKSVEDRIEELKKLHFNAGRWAGGARDFNARQAFERLNLENR